MHSTLLSGALSSERVQKNFVATKRFSGLSGNAGIIFFLSLFMQILGGELSFIPPIQWLPCHTVANLEVWENCFPLNLCALRVIIYNNHTILIGTVFLHVPHMQLMNQPFQVNIQPYNFSRNMYPRRGSRNLLEFGKKLGKIGVNPVRGGLFLFERRILRVQEFSIILYFLFLFFCFFLQYFHVW